MTTAAIASAFAVTPPPARQAATGKTMPAGGNAAPAGAVMTTDLSRMVEALNEYLASSQRSLLFHYDATAGRTIITVVDPSSNAIVRQIPPDELLALARAMAAGRPGLLDHYA